MDGYEGSVRHIFEGGPYRMKAGNSSADDFLRAMEIPGDAIVFPPLLIFAVQRQDGYDIDVWTCVHEFLDRMMKNRLPVQIHELFRQARAHSGTVSGSHHDKVFFSLHCCVLVGQI